MSRVTTPYAVLAAAILPLSLDIAGVGRAEAIDRVDASNQTSSSETALAYPDFIAQVDTLWR